MTTIVNSWDRLFPIGPDGATVINSKNTAILGQLIGEFFSKHYAHPIPGMKETKELQNFRKAREAIYSLQNISTTAGFEEFMNDLRKQYATMTTFTDEQGYRAIFDIQEYRGTNGWDVETESYSFTIKRIYEGDKIDYYGHSDSKYRVYMYPYGGGFAFSETLFMYRKWLKAERGLIALRKAMVNKMAAIYYALIEAIGAGQNIAWQAPQPAALPNTDAWYDANRDAQTIQLAVNTLYANNKNKGYDYSMNSPLFLLYPYQLETRLADAIALTMNPKSSEKRLKGRFIKIKTDQLASSTQYYVGIPKNKLEGGELMDITQFQKFDQDKLMRAFADWMFIGANVGDAQQVQRCLTS
jgi:hypothetical protein